MVVMVPACLNPQNARAWKGCEMQEAPPRVGPVFQIARHHVAGAPHMYADCRNRTCWPSWQANRGYAHISGGIVRRPMVIGGPLRLSGHRCAASRACVLFPMVMPGENKQKKLCFDVGAPATAGRNTSFVHNGRALRGAAAPQVGERSAAKYANRSKTGPTPGNGVAPGNCRPLPDAADTIWTKLPRIGAR